MTIQIDLSDQTKTELFGRALADNVERSAFFALRGQMGTGKTTFVKAFAHALGVKEIVASPTFVIMNEYLDGRIPLYHLDLYRLGEDSGAANPSNNESLDALDFLLSELDELSKSPSVVLVEWAEFLRRGDSEDSEDYLSERDHISLELKYVTNNNSARIATLEGFGPQSSELVNKVIPSLTAMMLYS
jgi:tRNA threonylcarbamoyladenosine biosynthesis protein TsaE